MINRVVLVGRLTKDVELRYSPSGVAIARFTLAINRTFSNQQGEKEADFIQCTIFRKQAENVANFVKKGHLTGVEGRIQTGSYEGTDGKRVYTTEVICDSVQFLEPKRDGDNGGGNNQNNYSSGNNGGGHNQSNQNYTRVDEDPFSRNNQPIEVSDDDLPF